MFTIFKNQKPNSKELKEVCVEEPLVPMPKSKKTVKVKVKNTSNSNFVEFTDGFGERFIGVTIHTITTTKWKQNPTIYVVVIVKQNGFKIKTPTLKWINKCYCKSVNAFDVSNRGLDVFNKENWDMTRCEYIKNK